MVPNHSFPLPMSRSLHKDISIFLERTIVGGNSGHKSRRISLLSSLIQGCMQNGHCRLESLSEASTGSKTENKSSLLQQTKRFLSNKWVDWESFFLPFIRTFLARLAAQKGELVFIMDGSQTGTANTTLMVSVLYRGYAIPIAWVVKAGEKGHFPEEMHLELLELLALACPTNCRVVLLGDGEFDGQGLIDWCVRQQWLFVTRTSTDRRIDFGGEINRFDSLCAGFSTIFIPNALHNANAVYWHGKNYTKPLYLLTNFDLAKEANHYYKKRMKIETLFKHLKSSGFFLHKTRVKDQHKLSNLIIVIAFAFIFSLGIGILMLSDNDENHTNKIVPKKRLANIHPVVLAQLAFKNFNYLKRLLKLFSFLLVDIKHFFT